MRTIRSVYHLLKADYLERVRRSAFLIILGIVVFAGYVYTPAANAGYRSISFRVDSSDIWYRGVYNSAWVGTQIAIWATLWLVGVGFFLVRNAVERDVQTGVGQIIATTPLTKVAYVLGKVLSNLAVLATMVVVLVFAAGIMQFLRGEDTHLDLWQLVSPFLFMTVPAIVFVAALAVLFECVRWLRGAVGSTIYLLFFVLVIIVSFGDGSGGSGLFDLLGVSSSLQQIQTAMRAAVPSVTRGIDIGTSAARLPPRTFLWQGNVWSSQVVEQRLLWLVIALMVMLLAALFFSRFDPTREKRVRAAKQVEQQPVLETSSVEREEQTFVPPVLTPVAARGQSNLATGMAILIGELRLLFKEVPWWWYIGALVWIALCLFLPFDIARNFFLPIAWLWPLPIWSSLGNREKQHNTQQLIFPTAHILWREFPLLYLAGVCITLFAASGMIVRYLLVGNVPLLIAAILGAFFIPALALFAGVWSSGRRLFEVIYLALWYIGAINHTAVLDFMGVSAAALTMNIPYIFAGVTLVLLVLAVTGRNFQMHSRS